MTRKGQKPLSLAVQAMRLEADFPDSDVTLKKHIALTWIGQLQPHASSETYTVKVVFRLEEKPVVTVLSPHLRSRNGKALPHVFSGNELCLYRAKYREWNPGMFLAKTIIPWASLWLLHYEIWHVTGKWCGSRQEHPGDGKQKEQG